ncbi:MAG: hypothetical protein PHW74_09540 [Desulfobacca sp.]|nr:hypothetical protein [Desulfobacca sp.]
MAKSTGWTFFWAILLGILLTTIFWVYSPFLRHKVSSQVEEALQNKEFSIQTTKGTGAAIQGAPAMAQGNRFMLVSSGNQTFLADLKDGRVWRYFQHTREGGWSREAEGFIPLSFHYQGKKFFTASEASSGQSTDQKEPTGESAPDSN